MKMGHSSAKSSAYPSTWAGRIAHYVFGDRDPRVVFGYVNPWHAAMEDFTDHTEMKTRSKRRLRVERKIDRPENRRPTLRL